MRRRNFIRPVALATVLPLATLASVPVAAFPSPKLTAQVLIRDETFMPKTLHVRAGTTVTWTNQDDVVHTVTSGTTKDAGKWQSGSLSPSKTFKVRFVKPGTYAYYCMPHFYNANMHASIVVSR